MAEVAADEVNETLAALDAIGFLPPLFEKEDVDNFEIGVKADFYTWDLNDSSSLEFSLRYAHLGAVACNGPRRRAAGDLASRARTFSTGKRQAQFLS